MAHVSIAEREGIGVLTLDRPPANAMDLVLMGELVEALERLSADVPPALVIAGREGYFSAGADLKAVPDYGPAEQRGMVEAINAMALGVYGLPCPVVCAITGHAIAGGMVLALCGDHRVAATAGRYGLTEVKVGVPYPQAAIGVVRAELAGARGPRPRAGQSPGRRGRMRAPGRLRRSPRAGRGARSRPGRRSGAGGHARAGLRPDQGRVAGRHARDVAYQRRARSAPGRMGRGTLTASKGQG